MSIRRVVAKIPSDLYVRLVSTKLYSRLTLEKLMLEGITLVIAKYRLEKETTSDGSAASAPES